MASPKRVIIDTDPGVDDTLALLLALTAMPDEIEVLLLSITFGNIDVQNCLRNVVSMFHVIEKELEWRRKQGLPEGFESMKAFKPIIAIGAEEPLEDQLMMADYFHGTDGLGGIHTSHPHLTPAETWKKLFEPPPAKTLITEAAPATEDDLSSPCPFFTPCHIPAHQEILRLLRDNPPDTITIVAIGPLTNLAIAAETDPNTFLRVKEVVVMGGALSVPGNITPVAEFNVYADSVAAARVFALTSPRPSSTLPPPAPSSTDHTPLYPSNLYRQLRLTLFPMDITTPHLLHRSIFTEKVAPLIASGSPLAEWVSAFLSSTFHKISTLHGPLPSSTPTKKATSTTTNDNEQVQTQISHFDVALALHDPLCIWYILTHPTPTILSSSPPDMSVDPSTLPSDWVFSSGSPEDIRIETSGQWTRGMCVIDRRDRLKLDADTDAAEEEEEEEGEGEPSNDAGRWLDPGRGNRIWRAVNSPEPPGMEGFGRVLLERVFG